MVRLVRTAIVVALTMGAGIAFVGPAQADSPIVCTGNSPGTYSPPLGPTPTETTVQLTELLGTADDGTCTGPFTAGSAEATFDETASCLLPPASSLLLSPPDVLTYHWNDGQTSTITYTLTSVAFVGAQTIVTSAGTVTAGYGTGRTATRVKVAARLDVVRCLTTGIATQSAVMTLTIT